MYELRFAPQPTDLRPAIASATLLADYDPSYDTNYGAGATEELDSFAREEEELLFAAWASEVDAGDPPF